jgi:hypothetical protein
VTAHRTPVAVWWGRLFGAVECTTRFNCGFVGVGDPVICGASERALSPGGGSGSCGGWSAYRSDGLLVRDLLEGIFGSHPDTATRSPGIMSHWGLNPVDTRPSLSHRHERCVGGISRSTPTGLRRHRFRDANAGATVTSLRCGRMLSELSAPVDHRARVRPAGRASAWSRR